MFDRMIRQILNRLLMKGINRGIDMGIDKMAGGRFGAKKPAQPSEGGAEADRLQQERSREMAKRVQDISKVTRRMR